MVATVTGVPSVVIVPVTSVASFNLNVTEPVSVPEGSITSLYGPVCGSTGTSKKVAALSHRAERPLTKNVASGLVIVKKQLLNVLLEMEMLTCWLGWPAKVKLAFWPGTEVVAVTGEPNVNKPPWTSSKRYVVRIACPVLVPGDSKTM